MTATALSVPQVSAALEVSAALDRYRNAKTPSVGRQGPYPTPPNARDAYHYVLTDYGERWIAWAIGVGMINYYGQDDT